VPVAQQAPPATKEQTTVPPAVLKADEEAEFIDLPERGKDVDRIAGLDVPAAPPENPAMPAPNGPVKVALSNAQASRLEAPPGVSFEMNYRFASAPIRGQRYIWIVRTATGKIYSKTLQDLQTSGTLSVRLVGSTWLSEPYESVIVEESNGLAGMGPRFGPRFGPPIRPFGDPFAGSPFDNTRQRVISNVLVFR
jgi:hypothetical protein